MTTNEAIKYLDTVLAPKVIRHYDGVIATVSPAFVGPLTRREVEEVLACLVGRQAVLLKLTGTPTTPQNGA